MWKYPMVVAVATAMALGFSLSTSSQNKTPSATTMAQSSAGSHDLSGVWNDDDHPRPDKAEDRYWVYKFTADEPPMTPWGKAQFDAAKSAFGPHPVPMSQTNDSVYHSCTPPGFPRIFLYPLPMEIVHTTGQVVMLFEYDSIHRQIYTDGRQHDPRLPALWMGESIGHWEGDTLVVDTVNFNDKTWLDRIGHPHSDQLHVIERIRRVDHDHLEEQFTIDDAKAYTKPWTARITFVLHPKWTLDEYFCEDQDTFENIENNELKPLK